MLTPTTTQKRNHKTHFLSPNPRLIVHRSCNSSHRNAHNHSSLTVSFDPESNTCVHIYKSPLNNWSSIVCCPSWFRALNTALYTTQVSVCQQDYASIYRATRSRSLWWTVRQHLSSYKISESIRQHLSSYKISDSIHQHLLSDKISDSMTDSMPASIELQDLGVYDGQYVKNLLWSHSQSQ